MMPETIVLPLQTAYAELLERCQVARLATDFPVEGSFVQRAAGERSYWYFRANAPGQGRRERYVGRSTPDLDEKVAQHGRAKDEWRKRRDLVVALQRAGFGVPPPVAGRILETLSGAGVFRLRTVLIGTIAYQTYAGLLGSKLGQQNTMTADLDLAQFRSISLAVEDETGVPLLAVLRRTDAGFRAVPALKQDDAPTSFTNGDFRVDVLVPNRGPETNDPTELPAIGAHGTALRFLDYLIYCEVQAVVLHGTGILVNVPAPERYALHKLLVSRARHGTAGSQVKAAKDLRQAAELIAILADARPYELRDAWEELTARGPKWRIFAREALILLDGAGGPKGARAALERVVGGG